MRIQQVQNTQRIYDDIRVTKIITSSQEEELLTTDLISEDEEVYIFEIITSHPCQLVFTYKNGRVSHPKQIEIDRVVTFENLRPIKAAKFVGKTGTKLEIGIAV